MKATVPMFEKIVKTLPRGTLDALAQQYTGVERPWNAARAYLEVSIISAENAELRIAVAKTVLHHLHIRVAGELENA